MTDDFFLPSERARAIVGCVTRAPLRHRDYLGGDGRRRRMASLTEPGPLRVRGALGGSFIHPRIVFRGAERGLEPEIENYAYPLLDRHQVELLAWHFHPDGNLSPVVAPHLHVSASLRPIAPNGERGMVPLDKRHLPTGIVSLAAFVRMLIEEFGVEPLARDWQARLADA